MPIACTLQYKAHVNVPDSNGPERYYSTSLDYFLLLRFSSFSIVWEAFLFPLLPLPHPYSSSRPLFTLSFFSNILYSAPSEHEHLTHIVYSYIILCMVYPFWMVVWLACWRCRLAMIMYKRSCPKCSNAFLTMPCANFFLWLCLILRVLFTRSSCIISNQQREARRSGPNGDSPQVEGSCDVRLLIHQSQAGAVIGRSGSKVKELREVLSELFLSQRDYTVHTWIIPQRMILWGLYYTTWILLLY